MDCTECGVIERPHVFSGGTDNFIWHFLRLWTNEQFRSWTMATVLLLGGNINFGIMSSIERISRTENYYFSCWNWNASFTNHGLRANSLCIYLCLTQQMPIISIYAQQIHMHSHIFRRIVHKLQMPFARSFNDCWARCEFYYFISQSQNGNGIHSIRASHVFEENAIFDFFGFEFGITMIREWVQFVNNFFLMKRNELITCDPIVIITRRKIPFTPTEKRNQSVIIYIARALYKVHLPLCLCRSEYAMKPHPPLTHRFIARPIHIYFYYRSAYAMERRQIIHSAERPKGKNCVSLSLPVPNITIIHKRKFTLPSLHPCAHCTQKDSSSRMLDVLHLRTKIDLWKICTYGEFIFIHSALLRSHAPLSHPQTHSVRPTT